MIDSAHERNARLRIVERHLPLTQIHPAAYSAALAAECGAATGHYAAVRRALFHKRVAVEDGDWGAIARTAGVADTAAFAECVRTERFATDVRRDREDAARLGLTSTPAVIVNGTMYRGTLPLSSLEEAIERRPPN